MGILDQLRNWTPDKDQGRSDFDDLPPSVYRPRVQRDMITIVKGATDLRDAMPQNFGPNPNAGMVITDPAQQRQETRPLAGQPTEKQRALIVKLVDELITLDTTAGKAAADYTIKMTEHNAWTLGREGNASAWITKLIDKIKATRAAKQNAPAVTAQRAYDSFAAVIDGRYAFVRDGKTHFYFVARRAGTGQYAGRTFLNVTKQAGDNRFPIKRWDFRKSVLEGIRAAGIEASHT